MNWNFRASPIRRRQPNPPPVRNTGNGLHGRAAKKLLPKKNLKLKTTAKRRKKLRKIINPRLIPAKRKLQKRVQGKALKIKGITTAQEGIIKLPKRINRLRNTITLARMKTTISFSRR